MILLNFSHPLTPRHIEQIEQLTAQKIERLVDINSQIDPQEPLGPQVRALIEQTGLSSSAWQSESILINPPALNFIAVVLLAELHGRCGYFPAIMRLRPVVGCVPPRYEVAEILNLQGIRDEARTRR